MVQHLAHEHNLFYRLSGCSSMKYCKNIWKRSIAMPQHQYPFSNVVLVQLTEIMHIYFCNTSLRIERKRFFHFTQSAITFQPNSDGINILLNFSRFITGVMNRLICYRLLIFNVVDLICLFRVQSSWHFGHHFQLVGTFRHMISMMLSIEI